MTAATCQRHCSQSPCSPGQEVALCDGRPNGELLLATGTMEAGNPTGKPLLWCSGVPVSLRLSSRRHCRSADCLFMAASLVAADRLYTTKREILEELGLGAWVNGSWRCVRLPPWLSCASDSSDCAVLLTDRVPPLRQASRRSSPSSRTALPRSSWSSCGWLACRTLHSSLRHAVLQQGWLSGCEGVHLPAQLRLWCCAAAADPGPPPPAAPWVQINFEQDTIISPENEYEILQLLMGDLRDRWVGRMVGGLAGLAGLEWVGGGVQGLRLASCSNGRVR